MDSLEKAFLQANLPPAVAPDKAKALVASVSGAVERALFSLFGLCLRQYTDSYGEVLRLLALPTAADSPGPSTKLSFVAHLLEVAVLPSFAPLEAVLEQACGSADSARRRRALTSVSTIQIVRRSNEKWCRNWAKQCPGEMLLHCTGCSSTGSLTSVPSMFLWTGPGRSAGPYMTAMCLDCGIRCSNVQVQDEPDEEDE